MGADVPTAPGTAVHQVISSELPDSWTCFVCAWPVHGGTSLLSDFLQSTMHGLRYPMLLRPAACALINREYGRSTWPTYQSVPRDTWRTRACLLSNLR